MQDNRIFYDHEKQGFCGDFIPFYHEGVFHLFTIIGSDWWHLTTTDFIDIQNHGIAIAGIPDPSAQDRDIYTGSIFLWEGTFHMFYCGHNEDMLIDGKPSEVIMHAVSADLYSWERKTDIFLAPDESRYMRRGWRDAFVYYDEAAKEFRMLITGAIRHNHSKRWGCTALATSQNLTDWEIQDPLYSPYLYDAHECPDLFEANGKWYLIFSTFTRWWELRYRVAESSDGPWLTPKDDLLDNRSFYAAKTVTDGNKRYLVGWIARRENEKDDGKYLWGGTLAVHEITANEDGTLSLAPVSTVVNEYTEEIPLSLTPAFGEGVGEVTAEGFTLSASGYFSAKIGEADTDAVYLSCDIALSENASAGVLLRADTEVFEKWCQIEVDNRKERLFFDHFGKFFFDQYFDEARPLKKADKYHLEVVTKGSIIMIYCNGVALSTRCYAFSEGEIGIFACGGEAKITNLTVRKMKK